MGMSEIMLHTGLFVTKEEDLKTSLWAVKLSISSSDAMIITGLGKQKYFLLKERWTIEWMCCEWQHS